MQVQFSLLFVLHWALVLLRRLSWINKIIYWRLLKTTQKRHLEKMMTPFSDINFTVGLNVKSVLHNLPLPKKPNCRWCLSYCFSSRFAVPWVFIFIAGSGMKSLFTEINSSSHTAVFCPQITYVFINILLLLI